jgi:hypothetical protein
MIRERIIKVNPQFCSSRLVGFDTSKGYPLERGNCTNLTEQLREPKEKLDLDAYRWMYCMNIYYENLREVTKLLELKDLEALVFDQEPKNGKELPSFCLVVDNRIPDIWLKFHYCGICMHGAYRELRDHLCEKLALSLDYFTDFMDWHGTRHPDGSFSYSPKIDGPAVQDFSFPIDEEEDGT